MADLTPIVAFKRVAEPSAAGVRAAVAACLDLVAGEGLTLGRRALIKINAMSREVLPGRNTSPWFLDAVLAELGRRHPGVEWVIADTDVAGFPQFEEACVNWGYDRIAARHGAEIINLAHDPVRPAPGAGPGFEDLELPETLFGIDAIVNLPVMKTHVLGGISGCLKNHWGLLPRCRYQHHVRINEVIAEINRLVPQTVLNLVDGTIAMEGSGPKTGVPKVCSVVLAGRDRVATDQAILDFMGLDPGCAGHVAAAAAAGVGSTAYRTVGDPFTPQPFAPPQMGQDVVSLLERRLRAIPGLGKLLYHPWVAPLLGWVGTMYNEQVWFRRQGRRHLAEVVAPSPYREQYTGLGR